MRHQINYQVTKDKEGYYHQVINGVPLDKKFKTEAGLRNWIVFKNKMAFYGVMLGLMVIVIIIIVIINLIQGK